MAVKKIETVEIKPIEMNTVEVTLVGDTPLIMHAWSVEARRGIVRLARHGEGGRCADR